MKDLDLTGEDRIQIRAGIQAKYAKVAASPEGLFQYPTGKAGLKALDYNVELMEAIPDEVAASYCGVGNPFSLGTINEGEAVLDIGCGAGVDTLVAAILVGQRGRIVGIDLISDMLERARENLEKTSLNNVTFQEASAQDLPFPDTSFDVVISNGVFNLIPEKIKALKEVFRVLKPFGRLMIADQVLTVKPPEDTRSMVENWAG
jgi:arsenite methyltransferase